MAGANGFPSLSKFPRATWTELADVLKRARYREGNPRVTTLFQQDLTKSSDLTFRMLSDRERFFFVNFNTIEDDLGPEVTKWFQENMPELRRLATAGRLSEAELKHRQPNTFGQNFAKKLLSKNVTEITLTSHPDPNIKSVENVPRVRRLRDAKAIRAMLVAMSRSSQSFEGQDPQNAPDRPQELSFIYKEGTENIVDSICWWRSDSYASGEAFAKLFSEHFESSNR